MPCLLHPGCSRAVMIACGRAWSRPAGAATRGLDGGGAGLGARAPGARGAARGRGPRLGQGGVRFSDVVMCVCCISSPRSTRVRHGTGNKSTPGEVRCGEASHIANTTTGRSVRAREEMCARAHVRASTLRDAGPPPAANEAGRGGRAVDGRRALGPRNFVGCGAWGWAGSARARRRTRPGASAQLSRLWFKCSEGSWEWDLCGGPQRKGRPLDRCPRAARPHRQSSCGAAAGRRAPRRLVRASNSLGVGCQRGELQPRVGVARPGTVQGSGVLYSHGTKPHWYRQPRPIGAGRKPRAGGG